MKRFVFFFVCIGSVGFDVRAANKCAEDTSTPRKIEEIKSADGANPVAPTVVPPPPPVPPSTPDSIRKVSRPIEPGGSQRFDLNYAIFSSNGEIKGKSRLNSRPTIVFIGGGPGQPNIGAGRDPKFPPGYDIIRLDQRGAGLNQKMKVKDFSKTFSSKQDADDVKAIIKAEGLKNYVVWGQSYGTVVATKLGADLGRSKEFAKPKSIILEGVFGRALRTGSDGIHEGEKTLSDSSNRIWQSLSEPDRVKLKNLHTELEKRRDGTAEQFEKSLFGTIGLANDRAAQLLAASSNSTVDQTVEQLKQIEDIMKAHQQPSPPPTDLKAFMFMREQYRAVACNELQDTTKPSKPVPLFGGLFTIPSLGATSCGPCFEHKRAFYDSKAYQIQNIPVHYLQGEADWRTPPWQAQYHSENQKDRERSTFSLIPNGSHIPSGQTQGPLDSSSCFAKLVPAAFAETSTEFTDAISNCTRNAPSGSHQESPAKSAR